MNIPYKKILIGVSAFFAYRLYKLVEFGQSIVYSIQEWGFIKPNSLSDYLKEVNIYVNVEILNPTNTTLSMRGIDGQLIYANQIVGTFFSDPFILKAGRSQFQMIFKVNGFEAAKTIVKDMAKNNPANLKVKINAKIPFITIPYTYNLNVVDFIAKTLPV